MVTCTRPARARIRIRPTRGQERIQRRPHAVRPVAKSASGGALTLWVAGERHELASGQCARFPAGLPHRHANEGPDPVQLTMVVVVRPPRLNL
jgi:quercetin dioxygenase-like cupin family protein